FQLSSAQYLGTVLGNSALNERITELFHTPTYLRIDSASPPLTSDKGLFVATSTDSGSFYYAVTANVGEVEDTTIVIDSNSIASPVNEDVQFPQPVWQQSTSLWGKTTDIYVQFVTKVTSSIYPQMTNVGSFPFNFALVKFGTVPPYPLTLNLHGQFGNFLEDGFPSGIGTQNEYVIAIDDWIPNGERNTYFYGYQEDYNIRSTQNKFPVSGVIYNYTSKRILYTLNWAIRNLPVDSTRVYMFGVSMGGTGTLLNALMIPKKIAAILVYVARLNMSNFWYWEEQWGKPAYNLMTNEGYKRNDRINASFLAGLHKSDYIPIMYTFFGKKDLHTGWDEKPPFYNSINNYRHGGFHFWSNTDHYGTANGPWGPSFPSLSFFARYRTDLSYPAFSNSSINDNPGNGNPSNGDPIGSINGHLDWDDNIVDLDDRWEIKLFLKDLITRLGPDTAPDSATTDVTLRRLQNFSVPEGLQINWENRRNNISVQQGSFVYDSGLVTITGVKVYKDSSRLSITYGVVSVDEKNSLPIEFTLMQNYPNPFNPTTSIQYSIASRQFVELKIFNVLGQEIKTIVNEEKPAGNYQVEFNAANLPSGVYFYRIQAGSFNQVRKMLLIK
ncbi:MAG: T9SS type A sorting domain-containing protein, partial [Ignavibacteriaceae bacterium]